MDLQKKVLSLESKERVGDEKLIIITNYNWNHSNFL